VTGQAEADFLNKTVHNAVTVLVSYTTFLISEANTEVYSNTSC